MKWFFLSIFIISSLIHLYGSFIDNRDIRNPSKIFILPGILGYYLCVSENISLVVVLAIFFSWLGDLFLIKKGMKWFVIGGISFMISHFFFMIAYYPNIDINSLPFVLMIFIACIYLYSTFREFSALKPYLAKPVVVPMVLYLIINASNNIFAWAQFFTNKNLASLIVLIGAICFFISDSALFLVRFHARNVVLRKHFIVMLTYIIAEFMIVYGLMMI